MQQKETAVNGRNLSYRIIGAGKPVVLLHGFGENGNVWKHQFEALQNAKLIVPDLPGSGGSEVIDDMSMEGLAGSVYELLQKEGIEKCTMIGHSMGGYVLLAYAEKYPGRLHGLGLFHSSAYADTEEKKATRRKGIDFMEKNGAFEFLKTTIPNLYSPVTREQQPALPEEHLREVQHFGKTALIAYYQSMMQRPDRTQVLKQNKVPVLFVLGRYDSAVPLQDGLQQAHLPSLSHVHILEQSGHMGMCEEPDKSNAIVNEFLLSVI